MSSLETSLRGSALRFISVFILMVFVTFTLPTVSKASMNLVVYPNDKLFDLENMKPGDWAPRNIQIENHGEEAFEYQVHTESIGDEKLFNQLKVQVKYVETVIFEGHLKDFNHIDPKLLEANEADDLEITLFFPEELGNEYQGLQAHFNIIITATGDGAVEEETIEVGGSIESGSGGGGLLPDTATPFFSIILIGGILLLLGGSVFLYKYLVQRVEKLQQNEIR